MTAAVFRTNAHQCCEGEKGGETNPEKVEKLNADAYIQHGQISVYRTAGERKSGTVYIRTHTDILFFLEK